MDWKAEHDYKPTAFDAGPAIGRGDPRRTSAASSSSDDSSSSDSDSDGGSDAEALSLLPDAPAAKTAQPLASRLTRALGAAGGAGAAARSGGLRGVSFGGSSSVAPLGGAGGGGLPTHEEPSSMRVFVQVGDGEVFDMSVGEGRQTCRWLALVAQRRAHSTRAFGSLDPTGSFLGNSRPMCVTLDGVVIAPTTRISELRARLAWDDSKPPEENTVRVLKVQMQDAVKLPKKAQTPPDGGVVHTEWAMEAFGHSSRSRVRLERMRKEREAIEKAKQEEEEKKRAEEDAKTSQAFDSLLTVDMDDPDSVKSAMGKDWDYIRISEMAHNEEEVDTIKKLLLTHFVDLNDCFKHFAGGSAAGRTDEMSLIEFQQMLTILPGNMFNFGTDSHEIKAIFVAATSGRDADDDAESLTRFEYLEALLRFACWKYGNPPHTVRRPGRLSTSMALKKVLEEHVVPGMRDLGVGAVRQMMKSAKVRVTFARSMMRLRRVFDNYCRAEFSNPGAHQVAKGKTSEGASSSRTMNFKEFMLVVRDSGLLKSQDGAALKESDVRRIFAGAQDEEGGEDMDPDNTDSDDEHTEELVLSEFIEAIARIALAKYKGREGMPDEDKVARGVMAVAKLDKGGLKRLATARKATNMLKKAGSMFAKAKAK